MLKASASVFLGLYLTTVEEVDGAFIFDRLGCRFCDRRKKAENRLQGLRKEPSREEPTDKASDMGMKETLEEVDAPAAPARTDITNVLKEEPVDEITREAFEEEKANFEIPIIDVTQEGASAIFANSCKQTGFAVLTKHGIDQKAWEDVYQEWQAFLTKLDTDPKYAAMKNNLAHDNSQAGFFSTDVAEQAKGASTKDIKRYYQIFFPEKGTRNAPWQLDDTENPDNLETVSDKAEQLMESLYKLGTTLVAWVEEHMDPEIKEFALKKLRERSLHTSLVDAMCRKMTMFRVLNYPAYDESKVPVGSVRAAAHEDINCLTVLPVGSSKGLQVQPRWGKAYEIDNEGKRTGHKFNEWIDVPIKTDSIVVNVGDMLQALTGHSFVSTTHRVIKAEAEATDRMSCPCFIHFESHAYLSERYLTAGRYLRERLLELKVFSKEVADAMDVEEQEYLKELFEKAGKVYPPVAL